MATTDFSSDQPVTRREEDRLNRTAFADRIAAVLCSLPSGTGLVVGIHGPWGDGKTTVLNLLRSELVKTKNIATVDFNPWRFMDEAAMLVGFFQLLASTISAKLTTKREDVAAWFEKCGRYASVLDDRLGNATELAASMSEPGLEELRDRLIEALSAAEDRIVVLVDDVDRLDKNETHTLFRLIKACADFPNVCYVLAFDDVAVAKSLGERYGGGDEGAGRAFLEKIIQIPLKLPIAAAEDLRALCFEQLDRALTSAGIELSKEQVGTFVSGFDRGLSLRLSTPREVKRYGNALNFALPMLKGEVNIVDLLLLEAVRAFYPMIYECLRSNHADFSGVESEHRGRPEDGTRSAQLLDPLLEVLSEVEQRAAKSILVDLFPRLGGTYGQGSFGSDWLDNWVKAKRVCSPEYCPRYFTYAIPLDDISDSKLKAIITDAIKGKKKVVSDALQGHFKSRRARRLIEKLRAIETEIDARAVPSLCTSLAAQCSHIPNPQVLYSFAQAPAQAAILISRLIRLLPQGSQRVDLAKEVIESAEPLWFGAECLRWLHVTEEKDKADHNTLTKEQIADVGKTLVRRIKERAAGGETLFDVDISQEESLLYEWWRIEGRDPVQEHLEAVFKKDPEQIGRFLQAIAPQSWGEKDVVPKVGGFERSQLKNIELIFDLDLLASLVRKHCPGDFDNPQWRRGNDISIEQRLAEQYMFIYQKWKRDGDPPDANSESQPDANANE